MSMLIHAKNRNIKSYVSILNEIINNFITMKTLCKGGNIPINEAK